MKQQQFESRYSGFWDEYDNLVAEIRKKDGDTAYELPQMYRRMCSHYALARERYYSPYLVARLQRSIRNGHDLLYRPKSSWLWRLLGFLWVDFPAQVRANYRYFWLSLALFAIPAVLMALGTWYKSDLIFSVVPAAQVEAIDSSYDPANTHIGVAAGRRSATDFKMFGFYIQNNISIGLRAFAMGILFGVGTVLSLIYNGVFSGSIAGHITAIGYSSTFWPFVAGHSAFELTAIIICGAAGLRLARPLLSPGQLSRIEALRIAGIESIQMVVGAIVMFVIAAWIEAFWSSSTYVSTPLKLVMATILWTVVTGYLLKAGKSDYGR